MLIAALLAMKYDQEEVLVAVLAQMERRAQGAGLQVNGDGSSLLPVFDLRALDFKYYLMLSIKHIWVLGKASLPMDDTCAGIPFSSRVEAVWDNGFLSRRS